VKRFPLSRLPVAFEESPSLFREGWGGSPFFYIVAIAGQFVLHGEL